MTQPPTTSSVPPADVEGELTLAKIAQHVNFTRKPWVMELHDGRMTLKLALVTSKEWQAAMQEQAFFAVLTVAEFEQFLGYAGRALSSGTPWTLRELRSYSEARVKMHRGIGPVEFISMRPDSPREDASCHNFSTSIPTGWTLGKLQACIVCRRGVATHDRDGRPLHPSCMRSAPRCRSRST